MTNWRKLVPNRQVQLAIGYGIMTWGSGQGGGIQHGQRFQYFDPL